MKRNTGKRKFVVKASSQAKMRKRIAASTVKRGRKITASSEIRNRSQIVNELAEMLKQFDKDLNRYQTDVYLYYDPEKKTAELDTFTNVGGNSWLDDDHYTIYSDPQHQTGDDPYFYGYDKKTIAETLGKSVDELIQETADYLGYTGVDGDYGTEDVEYREILDYIEQNDDYMQIIIDEYNDSLDDYNADYYDNAERIISEFEDEYDLDTHQYKGF